ncbi:uncharacterized protein LY89DRAFT_691610 [Mollisia scopiformis]|uniref:Uncharacterized protein n=1 Tax=Mollisia scopiformis TaxID=149040 RepID=A0A132B532_MOLSC|nr:uncharacterized protein LY89DRAFT_691610 [Mollisia scopiformis]KUJ07515.1 hypothetical protein LY89DRAFT_691610 [Mollisia scopiformis]
MKEQRRNIGIVWCRWIVCRGAQSHHGTVMLSDATLANGSLIALIAGSHEAGGAAERQEKQTRDERHQRH